MWGIAGFMLVIITLSSIQMKSLFKRRRKRETIVYFGLMGLAAIIGCLLIAGIKIPSPTIPLQIVFEPIGKMILKKAE
ncbi:hypothetical protein [Paenibacillus spongiae]|uniref:Uncharacterized protein n=1 Tax=Paenibacillus spongiae TaxID=2909671 RepID=A0ABY5SGN9_9BACL|nr:hypothetical protein [Paenibacillus spongiae]UVI32630.1 hypothetical protein L1F29_12735 [Paenibacillus spongiae]